MKIREYKSELLKVEMQEKGYRLFYKLGNPKGVSKKWQEISFEEKMQIKDWYYEKSLRLSY